MELQYRNRRRTVSPTPVPRSMNSFLLIAAYPRIAAATRRKLRAPEQERSNASTPVMNEAQESVVRPSQVRVTNILWYSLAAATAVVELADIGFMVGVASTNGNVRPACRTG